MRIVKSSLSKTRGCHCSNDCFVYLFYVSLQYDFPKQEAVIQFVIDAIQAEAFNPQTLFLIGSYTIGRIQYNSFLIFMLCLLIFF